MLVASGVGHNQAVPLKTTQYLSCMFNYKIHVGAHLSVGTAY